MRIADLFMEDSCRSDGLFTSSAFRDANLSHPVGASGRGPFRIVTARFRRSSSGRATTEPGRSMRPVSLVPQSNAATPLELDRMVETEDDSAV